MEIGELATLYRKAMQVQDAAVRDALSGAAATLAATQVLDAQAEVTLRDPLAAASSKALVARARKEVVAAAQAIAEALKDPTDAEVANEIAAEAIAAEAIAVEAVAAEPFAVEPLAAEPFAVEPAVVTNNPILSAALRAFVTSAGTETEGGSNE